MRILVADDESLVRYSIISILQDLLPEGSMILEAANGRELVERTRDSRPHIAFVDVHMPEMDGLEAIEAAREYAPRVLWVIVSGHSDFEYARRAMKLGVEEFLVKPVDPGELAGLMNRLVEKAREQQRRGNRELEARVSAVLGDTTSPDFDPWFAKPRFWQAGMILWDSPGPQDDIISRRREYAGKIQHLLDTGDEYSGCIVSCGSDALLVVLTMPTGGLSGENTADSSFWWSFGSRVSGGLPMDMVISLWHRRFEALRDAGRDLLGGTVGDTWLLTRVVQDPGELFREITDLGRDGVLRFIHRPSGVMDYGGITSGTGPSRFLPAAELLEELQSILHFGAEDDFHGKAHQLMELADRLGDRDFTEEGPAWYARYGIPLAPPLPEDLRTLARRLHDESHELFAHRSPAGNPGSTSESLAERAVEVMNRRYRETIGIAQVAEELGVTPNYLSTVFKKEVGAAFTGKLTELRLAKSRELLRHPDANIGEVARSLGYQSSRHFSRLFKEHFGVSPSQWIAGDDSSD